MNKLKVLYKKLIDKLFGKRCECSEVKKKKIHEGQKTRVGTVCIACGKEVIA